VRGGAGLPHTQALFEQLGAAEFPHLHWTVHLVVPSPPEDAPMGDTPAPPPPPQAPPQAPPPPQAPQAPAARSGRSIPAPRPATAPAAAPLAAAPPEAGEPSSRPLPFIDVSHYARLCLPLPPVAACVPPTWRAAKAARDGPWPPAHITLLTSAEMRDALVAAVEAPAAAPFMRANSGGSGSGNAGASACDVASPPPSTSVADARRALVAAVRRVRTAPLHFRGLGVAVGAAGAACAFVVVDWPAGGAFRRVMGLPKADFHITLGFDAEDPHDVRKTKSSLLRAPPGGWPRGEAGVNAMRAAVLARAQALRARGGSGSAGDGGMQQQQQAE
jgi:hypothetical protein